MIQHNVAHGTLRLMLCGVLCVWAALLPACGSSPIAAKNSLKVYSGSVEEPWKVGMFQNVMGSSNEISTTSSGNIAKDRQPIKIFVRPAVVEDVAVQGNALYDKARAERELTNLVRESAVKWGRFRSVEREEQAAIAVNCRVSALYLAGDWDRSTDDLKGEYRGWFNSELSSKQVEEIARELLVTQVSLVYTDLKTNEQTHSARVTGQLAKGKGEIVSDLVSKGSFDGSSSATSKFDAGRIKPEMLPQLFGQTVDGAFVDSFAHLDGLLWIKNANPNGIRMATVGGTE